MRRSLSNLYVLASIVISPLFYHVVHAEVITIDWRIPPVGQDLDDVDAMVGDILAFEWRGFHNVNLHPSGTCEDTDSVRLGSTSVTTYSLTEAGTFYFACQVGTHCDSGQHITVTVRQMGENSDPNDGNESDNGVVGDDDDDDDGDDSAGQGSGSCTINGEVFRRGESVGDGFETPCGSTAEFPCFCNPDLDSQVYCPYCGFETSNNGYRCAANGETITFIDPDGVGQSCSCSVPDEPTEAVGACQEDPSAEVCEFVFADGQRSQVQPGETVGSDPDCGSDYLCFCNPNLPDKQFCPYCAFQREDGSTFCLGHQETETYLVSEQENIYRSCSCDVPDNGIEKNGECIDEYVPPQLEVDIPTGEGCLLTNPTTGEELFVGHGDAFDRWIDAPCGHNIDFPCFCNVDIPGKVECPYCRIPQADSVFICALENTRVTFQTMGTRSWQSCECVIDDPGMPSTLVNCQDEEGPSPAPSGAGCVTLLDDGTEEYTPNGESFGALYVGDCGPARTWPAICNTGMADGIEYPYCQFDSVNGIICAKDGQTKTFIDPEGVTTSCDCKYTPLIGPQSTCRDAPPSTPISPTPPTPTSPIPPSPPVMPPSASSPTAQLPATTQPSDGAWARSNFSMGTKVIITLVLFIRWHQG